LSRAIARLAQEPRAQRRRRPPRRSRSPPRARGRDRTAHDARGRCWVEPGTSRPRPAGAPRAGSAIGPPVIGITRQNTGEVGFTHRREEPPSAARLFRRRHLRLSCSTGEIESTRRVGFHGRRLAGFPTGRQYRRGRACGSTHLRLATAARSARRARHRSADRAGASPGDLEAVCRRPVVPRSAPPARGWRPDSSEGVWGPALIAAPAGGGARGARGVLRLGHRLEGLRVPRGGRGMEQLDDLCCGCPPPRRGPPGRSQLAGESAGRRCSFGGRWRAVPLAR
jgi:hypothetical protein